MVTVIIEDTIEMNNSERVSNPKVYHFDDTDTAQDFIDRLYAIDQGQNADNIVRARIIGHSVTASADAVPLILHTVHYEHGANPRDGERFLEDIDVLTIEEIESFRKQEIKSGVVFAYDNMDSLEPAVSEELPDYATRFDTLGANLFAQDANTTFHLSFHSDIAERLLEKYGDKAVKEVSQTEENNVIA
jgi:hypothetical protein